MASIGVKVKAAKEDMITEPLTTMLNSRNRRPVVPSINTIGKNTATKVIVVEITAKKFAYDGCHKIYLINDKVAEKEAKEIDRLQKEIISISQKELWRVF